MQPSSLKTLEDIREAAAFILEEVAGETAASYAQDRRLKRAVERSFEIIGEAIRRLGHHDPEVAGRISKHSQIIAFRNRLIHGYDLVDDALVWDTIRNHLPVLKAEVVALLAEEQDD